MSQLAAGGWLALFLLVLATRALGQSALSIASITAVGKSFKERAGLAMGVYAVLLSVGFMLAFVHVGTQVRAAGWRSAWAQIAYGLILIGAPAILFLREPGAAAVDPAAAPATGTTLADALKTPTFWIFGIATALFGLVSSGLGLFNQAVLAERGFAQSVYVTFLAATAIVALVGQFGSGWLSLYWPMPRLLAIAMGIYGIALVLLSLVTALWQLWIVAVLAGLSGGMITTLFFAVWGQAFGQGAPRSHPGRGADADGAGVGGGTARVRERRSPHRVVRTRPVDPRAARPADRRGRAAPPPSSAVAAVAFSSNWKLQQPRSRTRPAAASRRMAPGSA